MRENTPRSGSSFDGPALTDSRAELPELGLVVGGLLDLNYGLPNAIFGNIFKFLLTTLLKDKLAKYQPLQSNFHFTAHNSSQQGHLINPNFPWQGHSFVPPLTWILVTRRVRRPSLNFQSLHVPNLACFALILMSASALPSCLPSHLSCAKILVSTLGILDFRYFIVITRLNIKFGTSYAPCIFILALHFLVFR